MTWLFVTMLILMSLVKLVLTCLPSGVVEWISAKFEVHSKLSGENADVTIGGKRLEGQDKKEVIQHFNDAIFMEKYYIYPGDEHLYLHPKDSGTPVVIDTKKGKKDVRLWIFTYGDRVDVVKQYKKKVVAYCLQSDTLQKRAAGEPSSVSG
ncbi:YfmQ family protein [Bacillus glycinifermentans]|uniref:YfmQ family protein n=1 Tax=Bacillus glycinifermentans TaxID=1664069 RepID=UPI002DB7C96C|nr:YfmQ family protein [Bacillus glycinifermentans]MEC3608736.1 YfmQ family protein [Bacillus glycinifermentans]